MKFQIDSKININYQLINRIKNKRPAETTGLLVKHLFYFFTRGGTLREGCKVP